MSPSESRIRHYMRLQRFVTSILNIENLCEISIVWADRADLGINENFWNFEKVL